MSKHFWDQILIDMFSYSLAVISIFTLLGISLSHMEVGENILFPMLHSILGLMLFLLSCHSSVLPNKRVKLTVCVYVFVCVFLCVYVCFSQKYIPAHRIMYIIQETPSSKFLFLAMVSQ